jgi:gamma-glutamylcyclotransferase (GGCT)/AIG2-like uncharacterized protein YtfP
MLSKRESLAGVQVFVYGTLKPGEANYQEYCADHVIAIERAVVPGKLFALPMGYPAMTIGEEKVQGYLLSFTSSDILIALDYLEDYQPYRPAAENLYNRHYIEVYHPEGAVLGWAWVYLMSLDVVYYNGGVPQPDGWWSGC